MPQNKQTFLISIKKRTFHLALETIKLCNLLPPSPARNPLSNQLIRSATSIGANIIEGQASPSKKDFTNFLHHALKSANETKYWLALIQKTYPQTNSRCQSLLQETTEITKILGASIITLKKGRKQ